jgi:hypothetical protein
MMLASFHSSGREPLSRDRLNRVDSDGAIWWAVSFSSLGEIPSGYLGRLYKGRITIFSTFVKMLEK